MGFADAMLCCWYGGGWKSSFLGRSFKKLIPPLLGGPSYIVDIFQKKPPGIRRYINFACIYFFGFQKDPPFNFI